MAESNGFMYLARRKCGKVSAMAWDDPGYEKGTAKSVSEWLRRGDKVERIEVFKGDQLPEMICSSGCMDCMTPNVLG